MPLLYYARQSQLKTKDGVKQWHLTLKKVGRAVSLQQLGEMVAEKCSATPGDVHNVIRNLMSVMRYGSFGWFGDIYGDRADTGQGGG